ncbi:MAG: M56 family metallopeptidase [Clostridia bacterium]|nr:M56 family metallopeptidase [Clostridia bacterium]
MTEIFLHIVNMSITASILAVIVLLLRLLLKKAPKWISVLLWGLVAIRLICPFAVESPFSLMPKTDWVEQEAVPEKDLFLNSVSDNIEPIDFSSLRGDITIHYYPLENPEIEIHRGVSISFVLSCVWIAGMAVLILHTVISTVRLRKSIGAAIRVRDNIWESSAVDSPFVLGLFLPRIYVPRGMTEEDLAYVIAHEEAHIRRKDHWWKPFGFLLLTLHWFNPVMWLSYILLCRDIEMACDERVVKEYDEGQRADYSEALLECSVKRSALRRTMISACPLAFGEVSVKQRIKSVLNYKKPAFWIVVVAVIACTVTAVCFLTNPGSFHYFGSVGAGLRFPSTDPSAAELCDISINGQIIRDEFKGTLSIDGRQMEVSIFMDNDTPTIGYYDGPRREIYGILLVCDDKLSRFALKTQETNEYILYGMTAEEFEWEMKHRNYYVDYLHDVVLHDITVSDKAQIISDIHTEGRTVIIYGKDLDTEEINRTFYSEDDVMGTLEYLPSEDMRAFYACASTCLNGKVYVGYYHVNFPADGDKAELMTLIEDEYLTESSLLNIGFDFRNKKLEMHKSETDPSVFETAPMENGAETGYPTGEIQQPQIMLNGQIYFYSATGFDEPLPAGFDYVGSITGIDNINGPQEDFQGARVELKQEIYADKNNTDIVYLKYENGFAKYEVRGIKRLLNDADVIRLSGKGYDLTWEDFDAYKYKYIEDGSGLYIRQYEMTDENFSLWIGGDLPVGTPMYIHLKADKHDAYIDIRDGEAREFIEAFIEKQNDSSASADEIIGKQKYTGYFLRTETNCFFIAASETETFYKNEPVKISPPTWDKETTVNFDSFQNGDKIEVEILQIGDTEPRDMPVYSVVLVEEGTMDNISNGVIEYLRQLGYEVIDSYEKELPK